MKTIEAAEDSFGSANSYFLLMWAIVSVVVLTAFFEARSISAEKAEAVRTIDIYDELVPLVERVSTSLNRVVIAGPYFESDEKALGELRANSVRLKELLAKVRRNIADRRDLSVEQRIDVNIPANMLTALLYYNDPSLQAHGLVIIPDHDGLILAEHESGSLGIAATVSELRIQDAARLIWLSSIPMRDILASKEKLLAMSTSSNAQEVTKLGTELKDFAERASGWSERDKAKELWVAWYQSFSGRAGTPDEKLERLALEHLRLRDPIKLTIDAFRSEIRNRARATGEQSNIKLPGLAVPLRLSDALVILPWVLAFCLGAIFNYTSRGLRYATLQPLPEGHILGKIPGYLAVNGASALLNALTASALLAAPALTAGILPIIAPLSSFDAGWSAMIYWGGIILNGLIVILLFSQTLKVLKLLDTTNAADRGQSRRLDRSS